MGKQEIDGIRAGAGDPERLFGVLCRENVKAGIFQGGLQQRAQRFETLDQEDSWSCGGPREKSKHPLTNEARRGQWQR